MKISSSTGAKLLSRALYPLIAAVVLAATGARAGLQMDMHLYGSYFCFPWISTNSTPPSPTNTAYFVWSPTSTINNGIHFQLNPDNSITGSGSSGFPDYQAFIHEITNGNWTLLMTNAVSTNQYTFKVTVPSTLTSNVFAPVVITSPTNGQINVSSTPTFIWTGPVGWAGSLDVWDDSVDNNDNHSRVTDASLAPNQTSWPSPVTLPDGTNSFSVKYTSNATAVVTVSTPVDSLPIHSRVSANFHARNMGPEFFCRRPRWSANPRPYERRTLHVRQQQQPGPGQFGQRQRMSGETWWGPEHQFGTDAEAGGGAVQVFRHRAAYPQRSGPDQSECGAGREFHFFSLGENHRDKRR